MLAPFEECFLPCDSDVCLIEVCAIANFEGAEVGKVGMTQFEFLEKRRGENERTKVLVLYMVHLSRPQLRDIGDIVVVKVNDSRFGRLRGC